MIINEQIAEQAQQLQTEKITDTLLEEKFNQVWEQRIETQESQDVKIKVLIKDQIMALLQQEFPSDAEFVGQLGLPNTETYRSYNQLVGTIDVFLISTRDHFIVVSEPDLPTEKCRNQTVEVANHLFQKIDTQFAELGLTDIHWQKKQVSQILNELGNIVIKAIDDRNAGMSSWVETFVTKNNECNTLPLSKDIFVHVENRNVTNMQTFSHALTEEIVEMRRRLFSIYEHDTAVSVQWNTNPVSEILDKLWGCLDLCVFCKEPCMITSKDHVMEGKLHECVQHRPLGIGGYKKSDSRKMVVDFCSHKVSGDQKYRHSNGYWLYKEYKEHFPDWEIPPSSDTSKYWIWVMCKFQNELAEMYSMKIPDIEDIPEHWTSYTKQIAIDSL
ncbi:unnamed protein product [Mytilus edulis]|uniref:Uncharacterized protein n=1 Tax=Mytilus edulis TaxID=6550 RepID=A0A8S3SIY1_MYTED|nr:unnamed protein product [Mytilus edulis]